MPKTILLLSFIFLNHMTGLAQMPRLVSFPPDSFIDVAFSDSSNGWIVGSKSLYRTTDGGITWGKDSISNRASNFASIASPTPKSAWLVSGGKTVSGTTDAGRTWQTLLSFPFGTIQERSPETVHAFDSLNIWLGCSASYLGGSTSLLRSSDGGLTWSVALSAYYINYNSFSAIGSCSDSVVSTLFGRKYLFSTSDAGTTWKKDTLTGLCNAIAVKAKNCIWIVGDSGRILKSNGNTSSFWSQFSGTTSHLLSICALDTSSAWISGAGGIVLRTTDGGTSWQRVVVPTLANLNALFFVNNNVGWIVGDGVVTQYSNGQLTHARLPDFAPQDFRLNWIYPNPFNPSTHISFTLRREAFVELEVYDIAGRLLSILVQERIAAGDHLLAWTPSRLASGSYFLRLKVGKEAQSQRILFMK